MGGSAGLSTKEGHQSQGGHVDLMDQPPLCQTGESKKERLRMKNKSVPVGQKQLDLDQYPLAQEKVCLEIYRDQVDISESFATLLTFLGASLVARVCKSCTVLVWRNGSKKSYIQAQRLNVPIASPLWIQECIQRNRKADYALFPVKIDLLFRLDWFKVKNPASSSALRQPNIKKKRKKDK